ncbi:MAG: DNA double-strand break repair nuclease NurA [Nanoarchaeota archaeon]|mgnify:CR=1 FL=1
MTKGIIDSAAAEIGAAGNAGSWIIHTGGRTPIERSRFRAIEPAASCGDISFIDGGNAPIYSTPSQTCHLTRTCALRFSGKNRTETDRRTSIVMATSDGKEITLKQFGDLAESLRISLEDKDLKTGDHPVTLATAVELARHLSEIRAATRSAASVDGGIVVVDGDLNAAHPLSIEARRDLRGACRQAKAALIGCAKTNTACTETGYSAVAALIKTAPEGAWAYDLESNDGIYRAFSKLHHRARHCFMIESLESISDETLSRLASISNDLSFPGYPYGLIVADQLARVSNQERDAASIELLAKAAKVNKSVLSAISGSDAHGILDRMQY